MENSEALAVRVSVITIVWNFLLTVFKLFAGVVGNSGAMLSDAVHSASDVLSTLVVIVGVKLSSKESDSNHQYGHERIECVAAIILSALLFVTGVGIGYSGILKIFGGKYGTLEIPGLLPLVAAVISVAVKEGMYWYTRAAAQRINSGALMADAWHHRSDSLSSVGSFIGILGARLGFPVLDPVASVVICLFILKASWEIFMDAVDKMLDKACDTKTASEITEVINAQEGVLGIDQLKTRIFGNKLYVDIEIRASGSLSLSEAHEIAQRVHDAVENGFPGVKHCMVHVNPASP